MVTSRARTEWHPQVPVPEAGDKTLYTYAEAARFLRRRPRTIATWVAEGRIPAHLVTVMSHRSRYFTGEQLRQIIDLFAAAPPPAAVNRRRKKAA